MKRVLKIVMVTFIFSFIFTTKTFALEKIPSNIKLEGNSEGIRFQENKDEFLNIDNLLPGDWYQGVIDIENKHSKPIELYMRLEKDPKLEEYHLLDKLNLKVKLGEKEIYNDVISKADELNENIFLGIFKKGDKEKLTIEIFLDGNKIGNEYVDKKSKINWIFTANTVDKQEKPNKVINKNYGINKYFNKLGLPSTGDDSIYIIVSTSIVAIILGLIMMKKRKRDFH